MELWLRYKRAVNLEYDEKVLVTSQNDWHELVYNPDLTSSILWPDSALFQIKIKYSKRKHEHEIDYSNELKRNISYLNACKNIAQKLNTEVSGGRCLVYAPLRGALPIWRGISQFLKNITIVTYLPVTSSFVFYPEEFGIIGRKNKPASGRYNNRFELERIIPFLAQYDFLLYVDEIVSGGMMCGHLRDMFRLNIEKHIPIIAVGLADAFGERSQITRLELEEHVANSRLRTFIWEGCESLITEDQKFLLGMHYVDYNLGPHVVPLLDENLNFYPEKKEFDNCVFNRFGDNDILPDGFSAAAGSI